MIKLIDILKENEAPEMKHSVWFRNNFKYPAIIESWEDLEQKLNQLNPGKTFTLRSSFKSSEEGKIAIFDSYNDWEVDNLLLRYSNRAVNGKYFETPVERQGIRVYVYNDESGLAVVKRYAENVPYCFYDFMAFGDIPAEVQSIVDKLKGKGVFDSRGGFEGSKWTRNIDNKLDSLADRIENVNRDDWQAWRNKQMKYFQMKKPRAQR